MPLKNGNVLFCSVCVNSVSNVDGGNSTLQSLVQQPFELHQRAMDASSCGITIADATETELPLIYINEAFVKITGYTHSDTLGRNCRFLQADDRQQTGLSTLKKALEAGSDCTVTLRNYRRDGSLFHNELFISPIYDADHTLTHFVGIQNDITSRLALQSALEQNQSELKATLDEMRAMQTMLVHAEKMNALGQMVAGIAHEINNPLSFVNSNLHTLRPIMAELFQAYETLEAVALSTATVMQAASIQDIRRRADLDFVFGDTDDLLQASLDGLGRVKNIVQGLRTFARLDEADFKLASIQECVRSALLIAAGEIGERIGVIVEIDNLAPISCYPAELNQVFLNLIVNAAQAINDAGTITIKGRDLGQAVEITFRDTGVGIKPEHLDAIFKPFFTTKPAGTGIGLGLAISRKIVVDRHQGTITVASRPGEGSTFTITLPKESAI